MELGAAPYLYAIATIAVTFLGFSTLFTIFRQLLGGRLARYDIYLTSNFLQFGFVMVIGALLPLLLALFVVSANSVLRLSSMITIIPLGIFAVRYPSRRFAATDGPMPARVRFIVGLLYLAIVVLLVNVVTAPVKPGIAFHALAMTIVLFTTFLGYIFSLDLLFIEPARPVDKRVEDPAAIPHSRPATDS